MSHHFAVLARKNAANSTASIHYTAGDPRAVEFYETLALTEHNNGCSGDGNLVHVSRKQLEKALASLSTTSINFERRRFIQNALVHGGRTGCWIGCW